MPRDSEGIAKHRLISCCSVVAVLGGNSATGPLCQGIPRRACLRSMFCATKPVIGGAGRKQPSVAVSVARNVLSLYTVACSLTAVP
ncbi:hypothetical protein BaRGS_00004546 [Batillaria attramentaria]|uniref:Secreted protein n=1 Tax=Batillaria attramentaria TaxID=370345 RepID=A0ABD0LXM9_9CAEN